MKSISSITLMSFVVFLSLDTFAKTISMENLSNYKTAISAALKKNNLICTIEFGDQVGAKFDLSPDVVQSYEGAEITDDSSQPLLTFHSSVASLKRTSVKFTTSADFKSIVEMSWESIDLKSQMVGDLRDPQFAELPYVVTRGTCFQK